MKNLILNLRFDAQLLFKRPWVRFLFFPFFALTSAMLHLFFILLHNGKPIDNYLSSYLYFVSGLIIIMGVFLGVAWAQNLNHKRVLVLNNLGITPFSILMAKFLLSWMCLILFVFFFVGQQWMLKEFQDIPLASIASGFLVLLLLGQISLAVGFFGTCATRNKKMGFFVSSAVIVTLLLMWLPAKVFSSQWLTDHLDSMALHHTRYYLLSMGVWTPGDLIYYLSGTALFLFLAIYFVEFRFQILGRKKRLRGLLLMNAVAFLLFVFQPWSDYFFSGLSKMGKPSEQFLQELKKNSNLKVVFFISKEDRIYPLVTQFVAQIREKSAIKIKVLDAYENVSESLDFGVLDNRIAALKIGNKKSQIAMGRDEADVFNFLRNISQLLVSEINSITSTGRAVCLIGDITDDSVDARNIRFFDFYQKMLSESERFLQITSKSDLDKMSDICNFVAWLEVARIEVETVHIVKAISDFTKNGGKSLIFLSSEDSKNSPLTLHLEAEYGLKVHRDRIWHPSLFLPSSKHTDKGSQMMIRPSLDQSISTAQGQLYLIWSYSHYFELIESHHNDLYNAEVLLKSEKNTRSLNGSVIDSVPLLVHFTHHSSGGSLYAAATDHVASDLYWQDAHHQTFFQKLGAFPQNLDQLRIERPSLQINHLQFKSLSVKLVLIMPLFVLVFIFLLRFVMNSILWPRRKKITSMPVFLRV